MPSRLERGRPEQVLAANERGGPRLARAGFHGLDGRGAKRCGEPLGSRRRLVLLTWLDFDVAHFPVRMGYKRLALSLAVMVYAPELSSAAPIAF